MWHNLAALTHAEHVLLSPDLVAAHVLPVSIQSTDPRTRLDYCVSTAFRLSGMLHAQLFVTLSRIKIKQHIVAVLTTCAELSLCFGLVPNLLRTFLPFRFGVLVDCLACIVVQVIKR